MLKKFRELIDMVEANPDQIHMSLDELPQAIQAQYLDILLELKQRSHTRELIKGFNTAKYIIPFFRRKLLTKSAWPWAYACIKHYGLGTYDLRSSLEEIDIPVRVFIGERNELFGSQAVVYLMETIPTHMLCHLIEVPTTLC